MAEKGRCQGRHEGYSCDKGRVFEIEVSPGLFIWVCPKHKRMFERLNAEETCMRKEMFVRADRISPQMREVQEELDNQKVVQLRPITGGKTGPTKPWLTLLPEGCLFLAKSKKGFTTCLDEYRLIRKEEQDGENFTLLRQNRRLDGKDASDWEWHSDEDFSTENTLKKVLP